MYDKQHLKRTAIQWISDWNERDIKKIMAHYADEVIFFSDTVMRRWGNADGKLKGKAAVEKHFLKGLEEMPDMHFEYRSILYSPGSIILIYQRESGILAADMVKFDNAGKVKEVRAYYENLSLK
jgi:SnoaL-like domain